MSILIKGMKMPKDCPMCPLAHWNKVDKLTGCEIIRRYVPKNDTEYWQSDSRPAWCPLIEVPTPHGRLIDADDLNELIACGDDLDFDEVPETKKELMRMIDDAPTIIGAEGKE